MKIFISILLILVLTLNMLIDVDENVMKLHDETFQRAIISFGLAKGLNAVISLLQGTQLSLTPIGIGLNLSIGEVLDPFNDLVERFSWVMLVSSISLGVQKILLVLSSKMFLQVGVTLSVIISMFFLWFKSFYNKSFFILAFKILLLLFVLRFGSLVSVYTSDMLYNSTLRTDYIESVDVVSKTKIKLDEIHVENKKLIDAKEDSTWYNFNLKSKLDMSKKFNSIQDSIDDAYKSIINIITIFIIQTILFPLIFLWLIIISVKLIFNIKLNSDTIIKTLDKENR